MDDTTLERVATLRGVAARCRVMGRCDLFHLCGSGLEQSCGVGAIATTLLRALNGQHGMPRLVLYERGAREISFDEVWLLACLSAAERGDFDSFTFLLTRRLPACARRQCGQLFRALAAAFADQAVGDSIPDRAVA